MQRRVSDVTTKFTVTGLRKARPLPSNFGSKVVVGDEVGAALWEPKAPAANSGTQTDEVP